MGKIQFIEPIKPTHCKRKGFTKSLCIHCRLIYIVLSITIRFPLVVLQTLK